jgi:SAM-dependent methyltransferase
MSDNERGQVTRSAAEVYEEFFLPALFQQWASRVVDAAEIRPGHRVLDVACGTGVLTRAAADRVRPGGAVVGLDANAGMLAVAERKAPAIEWRQARAEALPFGDESFDRVVSQFGLMFFDDRASAIREMTRVARRGGRVTVAVWAALDATPGYAAVVALLERLFGDEVADALRAPFALGDEGALARLFAEAGVDDAEIATQEGTAKFSSIRSWIHTEVRGWTLADRIDDRQFEQLLEEAEKVLQPFRSADGSVAFAAPAHIVTATKK